MTSFQYDNDFDCSELQETENELYQLKNLYYERDREFEKAKGRRNVLALILFSVVYFIILLSVSSKPLDFLSIILCLIISPILSVLHFLVNSSVFFHISFKGNEEARLLRKIKWQTEHLRDYKIADSFLKRKSDILSYNEKDALSRLVFHGYYSCEAKDE